ncbi:hypothetical protein ACSFBI_18190 [Variovorax sp. RB3P1]|uniref:hypothetical protein n=1 Tax=Variovorax sp. RB3P1 TaxID=3443732 RepID=UPI003F45E947
MPDKLAEKAAAPVAAIADQVVAGRMLTVMATKVSSELAAFSSWMIAAAGAIFALALNGVDKLEAYVRISELGLSVKLFLVAAGLNALQRWFGAMVAAGSAVSKDLAETEFPPDADLDRALDLFAEAQPLGVRHMVNKSIAAVRRGDLMRSPTMLSRLAFAQSWLVLGQMALLLIAAWRLLP